MVIPLKILSCKLMVIVPCQLLIVVAVSINECKKRGNHRFQWKSRYQRSTKAGADRTSVYKIPERLGNA